MSLMVLVYFEHKGVGRRYNDYTYVKLYPIRELGAKKINVGGLWWSPFCTAHFFLGSPLCVVIVQFWRGMQHGWHG